MVGENRCDGQGAIANGPIAEPAKRAAVMIMGYWDLPAAFRISERPHVPGAMATINLKHSPVVHSAGWRGWLTNYNFVSVELSYAVTETVTKFYKKRLVRSLSDAPNFVN